MLRRLGTCLLAALPLLSGCGRAPDPAPADGGAGELFPLTFQLDWVAEPQHGGLYMAQALGLFAREGLQVTLAQGGPNANVRERLALGRAQLGQDDGNNVIVAVHQGLPLQIVAALFQHDPSSLLLHAGNPVATFAELHGQRVKARLNWAFLKFLRQTQAIEFTLLPSDFGLEVFAADPGLVQQGYFIAEPYHLEKMGVPVKWLHVWDAGYDGLSAVVANTGFIRAHPDRLRAFLRAYAEGQRLYFEGDPTPAHTLMLAANRSATAEFLDWSRARIIEGKLAIGDPARGGEGAYLRINPERVARQIRQMEQVGALPAHAVTVEMVFDGSCLPD
jgi:NitT/TauT family transport system substrate-binding protein